MFINYLFLFKLVAPRLLNASSDINVTTSKNFTLMCNASGYPGPSILWTHNRTAVNERSRITVIEEFSFRVILSVLMVSNATANHSGEYICIVSYSIPEFETVSSGPVSVLIQGEYHTEDD